jgi:3D-(3,5/4)-trihydroxycyclohexane-1,2-dione acylhydrolase (decyclizing)
MTQPETVRLTTAQALVRWIQAQHSHRDGQTQRIIPGLFGIFGHGNVLGIAQAIDQEGRDLPLYQPKNEQAMVHTALGFAKAARRLATLACSASIGPGSTNMITGAATATANRLPVLLLPSDTFANRRQGTILQQIEHPVDADLTVNDAFRPVSVFYDRITRPEQLLTALPQAIRALLDPAYTGAVTLSLPQDVQGEAFDYPSAFFRPRVWSVSRRPPAAEELAEVVQLLRSAKRPLIIAGGGVRYSAAETALSSFATEIGVPVAETSAGKGSLPAGHDWLVGGIGVNGTRVAADLAATADLVLCVGTRLTDFTTGSRSIFQHPDVKFVGVNVNSSDAHKMSATTLVADAREALQVLSGELADLPRGGGRKSPTTAYQRWRAELIAATASPSNGAPTQGEVLHTLNQSAQAGDWIVAAAGWQPGDLLKLWETPAGSYTHIEFGFSCMGHEIPAGLGIRLHEGDAVEVIVVIGDGTYLMNPTELVTAHQEGLKITVLVLDNGGYQSIARLADAQTGRSIGNEFRHRLPHSRMPDGDPVHLDFVANAASMGCRATLAATIDELCKALAEARATAESTVIVVPIAKDRPLLDSGVFWDLGVPETATSEDVADRAARFQNARAKQRSFE